MWGLGVSIVQVTGNGMRINVLGEEEAAGKLRRVRSDGGTRFPQKSNGKPTWYMPPPDEGGPRERRGTYHLYGVLPQGTQVGKVTGTRFPRVITQYRKATGAFHIPTFLVSDSSGPVGK